jgi:hypothetical protein
MSQAARRQAMRRKPPKRVDPFIEISVRLRTSTYLRLCTYAEKAALREDQVARIAILHLIGGLSEWQR